LEGEPPASSRRCSSSLSRSAITTSAFLTGSPSVCALAGKIAEHRIASARMPSAGPFNLNENVQRVIIRLEQSSKMRA
jgi:hypothetical protein